MAFKGGLPNKKEKGKAREGGEGVEGNSEIKKSGKITSVSYLGGGGGESHSAHIIHVPVTTNVTFK